MTDDLRRELGDTHRDLGLDAPLEHDDPAASTAREALRTDDLRRADREDANVDTKESNPLLREGANAADAADIEDPDNML